MIGDLIKAVSHALGITEKLVDDHQANKINEEEKKKVEEYQNILQINDPEDKRNKLGAFALRLCVNAGTPTGKLSGTSIEVPLECFDALIRIAIENDKQDKLLASMIYSLQKR